MLRNLYSELSRMDLKYHELVELKVNKIFLAAKVLASEGIEEVMRIKSLADMYRFCARWDGENIEIMHCSH